MRVPNSLLFHYHNHPINAQGFFKKLYDEHLTERSIK